MKRIFIFFVVLFYLSGYSQNKLCKKLRVTQDKYTKEKTIRSPYGLIYFIRVISKDKTTNYMKMKVNGLTLNVREKGVKILFSDGSVLEKPNEKIDTEVVINGEGYTYSVFMRISDAELKDFSTKEITDYRLYIYDQHITKSKSKKIKKFANCIINF